MAYAAWRPAANSRVRGGPVLNSVNSSLRTEYLTHATANGERACFGVESGNRTDGHSELVRPSVDANSAVTERQTAEHRNA